MHVVAQPHWIALIPFALLLVAIACGPLIAARWWHKHYTKVSFGLAIAVVLYYGFSLDAWQNVLHTAREYVSFIALIGSLFIVSGGIHIRVKGEATPLANTVYLGVGAVLANLLGTTGASMLMIRPWLRMNQHRATAHHVVFFIFIVSNLGGCLTPIGDPPLFLGYLKGIPFWWVTRNLWPFWLLGVGLLLAIFYVLDRRNYRQAPKPVRELVGADDDKWHFEGLPNLFFLAVILGAVFVNQPVFLREGLMVVAAIGSWFTTRKTVHQANEFTFHPIIEVAALFIGIFGTMMPALDWLRIHAAAFGSASPTIFYFGSGALSSVLDNAPTYLGFLSALFGIAQTEDIHVVLDQHAAEVIAISVGSVFFGAATYIGNGPNFMVKAIAEHQQVPTPTFFGYVVKFALPFLLPVLLVVWFVFVRT